MSKAIIGLLVVMIVFQQVLIQDYDALLEVNLNIIDQCLGIKKVNP